MDVLCTTIKGGDVDETNTGTLHVGRVGSTRPLYLHRRVRVGDTREAYHVQAHLNLTSFCTSMNNGEHHRTHYVWIKNEYRHFANEKEG